MAAPLLTALALASALTWGETTVTEVRFDAPGASAVAPLVRAFRVAAGAPLSREAVRRGVEALMATGVVDDVAVDAVPERGGVALEVHVQVASRVRAVSVTGLPARWARTVARNLGLEIGAPLKVPQFEHSVARTLQGLKDAGYPTATLDPDLEFDLARGTVDVLVRGELGAPVRIEALTVTGFDLPGRAPWSVAGLAPGDVLSSDGLERARRRVVEYVRRKGWWEAAVDEPHVSRSDSTARVDLVVRPGPHYTLDLQGVPLSRGLTAQALPFLQGSEPFSDTALSTTFHAVRTFLARSGYLLATVGGEVSGEAAERVLHVRVERGRRTPIVAVRFLGVKGVPEAELRDKVGARLGHPWRWGNEPVDEDTLAADAASLEATLREKGYADAKVAPPRLVPVGDGVAIEFDVEQGTRRTLRRLSISGMPAGAAKEGLPLRQGGAWSAAGESQLREALLSDLRDAGYPDARVTASHTCDASSCDVDVTAEAGVHADIDRIVLAGLVRTDRSVVDRVSGLQPGPWVGPTERLAAQRRLLGLGIFRSATLRPIPDQNYGPHRGMVLEVAEAPSRAVSFGIGWNTADKLRVSAGWSELNLFGLARTLSLETTLSSREKRYQISYREPARLGLLGFPSAVAVYRSEERLADYDFFRRGMWVELGDRQKRPSRFVLRYDYQVVENNAPDAIKSQLERDRQNIAIASITPIVEYDSRDDVFSPSRGVFATAQLANAFKVFMADVSLEKFEASVATYRPAFGGVFAVGVHGGGIEPRGAAAAEQTDCHDDNCLVPLAERFFAGGRVSQRAFPTDMLGIPGKTLGCAGGGTPPPEGPSCQLVALGGAGLLLASAEWRVPVWGPVGASVFVDGGNVWASWREIRVGEMRWGAGVGARVMTPVGPFRLEYGWKLDRKSGESAGELFLSFGNPF